jgi:hypothetical protein
MPMEIKFLSCHKYISKKGDKTDNGLATRCFILIDDICVTFGERVDILMENLKSGSEVDTC